MNAGFSYFLLDQFSLGGSDFSSFIGVWKEAPIKALIFCSDFGSTTIKLFQWHEIGVFKTYANSCCIRSQYFRVQVTRTSEIYFLVGCLGENQISECLWQYKFTRFLTPSSIFSIHDVKKLRKIAFQRCYQVYKIPANFVTHTYLR